MVVFGPMARDESDQENAAERRARLYDRPTYILIVQRVAANTKRMRAERGWSQQHTADVCELAKLQVQRVERGNANVTATVLARLADGFEVDPATFLMPLPPSRERQ